MSWHEKIVIAIRTGDFQSVIWSVGQFSETPWKDVRKVWKMFHPKKETDEGEQHTSVTAPRVAVEGVDSLSLPGREDGGV